jgi:hypothetical protein
LIQQATADSEPKQEDLMVNQQDLSFNQSFRFVPVENIPQKGKSELGPHKRSNSSFKQLETPLLDQYISEGPSRNTITSGSLIQNPFKKQSRSYSNPTFDPIPSRFVPVLAALHPDPLLKQPPSTRPSPKFPSRTSPARSGPSDAYQPSNRISSELLSNPSRQAVVKPAARSKTQESEPYTRSQSDELRMTVNSIRFKKSKSKPSKEKLVHDEFEEMLLTPDMITTSPPTIEVLVKNNTKPLRGQSFQDQATALSVKYQPLAPIRFLTNEESRPSQPRPHGVTVPRIPLHIDNLGVASQKSPLHGARPSPRQGYVEDVIKRRRLSSSNLQAKPSDNRLNESIGGLSSTSKNQAVRSPQRIVMSKNQFMKNRANTHKRIPIVDTDFEEGMNAMVHSQRRSVTNSPKQHSRTLPS